MLRPGDLTPHFHVTDVHGALVTYSEFWQRKVLVLIVLPSAEADGSVSTYLSQLNPHIPTLTAHGAACVVTRDLVDGLPSPGVVIADRWGEIVHIAGGNSSQDLPPPGELVEWASYVQRQCPECEGESR